MTDRIQKQLNFIKEIDKMKNILRMTLVSETRRRENDAEHSWHLAMMALLLEEYAVRPVDIAHVIKMSLVHDLVEIYAGDTFAYDIKGNIDKEERENKAADLLFSILPKDQEELMFSLWREFDAMQTDNSLFANALDRLQPFLSNVMTEGHTWKIGHVTKEKILWRMDPIRIATPALWQYLLDMIDELEKKGYISE
ncbi:MAG TPA: HD domain-containing protein [Clostridia bacterium]|nr:MAG: 5'-nucleotidase [Firmicutes bacterium ADurb.Bin146]HOD92790.1 HD domain-containing protein [Clostridia bacterium]HQM39560.1 HD domain-containing protein [Clostridia bacterium]